MKLATLIAAATATLLLAPCAASAAILQNGGFENIGAGAAPEGWGGLTYYTDGTHAAPSGVMLPGWTVESGSVDLTGTATPWGPSHSGAYSMDINGWSAGTIAQSFATVAGQTYDVSYFYSRNPYNGAPADATVAAGGVSRTVATLNDGSLGGGYGMLWKAGGFSFVGDGSAATLRLSALTQGNAGVFFDDVSVAVAVPEPTTWALMIGGLGMAGAMLRRRRSLVVA